MVFPLRVGAPRVPRCVHTGHAASAPSRWPHFNSIILYKGLSKHSHTLRYHETTVYACIFLFSVYRKYTCIWDSVRGECHSTSYVKSCRHRETGEGGRRFAAAHAHVRTPEGEGQEGWRAGAGAAPSAFRAAPPWASPTRPAGCRDRHQVTPPGKVYGDTKPALSSEVAQVPLQK